MKNLISKLIIPFVQIFFVLLTLPIITIAQQNYWTKSVYKSFYGEQYNVYLTEGKYTVISIDTSILQNISQKGMLHLFQCP